MKSTVLSLAAVLIMGLSAFAGKNDEVSKLAVRAFNKDFAMARNISWEQKDNFVKVTFTMNDQVMFAYYNNNGTLQAVVRNLVSDQLPINLLTQLKSEYSGYWISDLFEVASDDQTTYYVTLENADKKLVLNSADSSSWIVYSKTRKTAQ
jgi:hypothetical protein